MCPLSTTSSSRPAYVSVHEGSALPPNLTMSRVKRLIRITGWQRDNNQDKGTPPTTKTTTTTSKKKRHQFTVCVNALHHNVPPNQLVEFIEVNRMFGADHFILYNSSQFNISSLEDYLGYYQEIGIVSLHSWHVPDEINERVHYYGQIALLSDCLQKHVSY